jgi:hypothetical protein
MSRLISSSIWSAGALVIELLQRCWLPYHSGIQRVMVVDSMWEELWPDLGAVFTANIGYVKEAPRTLMS